MKNTIFSWSQFRCYLAGPVDGDRDNAAKWREDWTNSLVEIGFNRESIFNPCNKPVPIGVFEFDINKEAEYFHKFRSEKDWDKLCRYTSEIAHLDLHLVDKSNLVLVYMPKRAQKEIENEIKMFDEATKFLFYNGSLPESVLIHLERMNEAFKSICSKYLEQQIPTYGTMHEIVTATNEHTPVMVVWEGGKETCSAWLMWLVGHRNVFGSFEEMKHTLEKIAKGEAEYTTNDWLMFDFGKNV